MRRIPIFATIIVAAAVATMIALGFWQLRRMEWKHALLARLESAQKLPPLDETALFRPGLDFRHAVVTCRADAVPTVRAGRSADQRSGYIYLVPCRFPRGEVLLVAGWSERPDATRRIAAAGRFDGMLSGTAPMAQLGRLPYTLHATRSVPPLAPAAPPSTENIADSHLSYAIQWFSFAAIAAAIYIVALRRKRW